ncbi:outer membrane protein assembly factor BamA [candidate division KSB1 bacterium]|nr:outer membrane protein assembly factor BamA [candidate division KSB1 bacterium]
MKYYLYIIILFMAALVFAQDNYRVRKVIFRGNESFSSSRLQSQMTLEPKSGLKRIREKSAHVTFSRDLLQQDIQELTTFYQREGFLDVQIAVDSMRQNHQKNTLDIFLKIKEGYPVIVSEILFQSVDDSFYNTFDLDKLRNRFALKAGERFRDVLLKSDILFIKDELVNKGYAYSSVDYTLKVDTLENQTTVLYIIDTGPRCYFGDVMISGNEHVSDRIIRKQLAFEKGDVFSRHKIDQSQEQIYQLNVFQIASIQARLNQTAHVAIPISIKTKEAPRLTNKVGAGWGKEDQFRAFVDVQWLRFFSGARRLNLYVKHSGLEPYHVYLRFSQPAFLNPNTTLGVNPYIRKQQEPGYIVDRRGANLYLQRQIKRIFTAGIGYTYEIVKLDTTSVADVEKKTDLTDLYDKSSMTLGISQNNTDDIFSPTRGTNNGLTLKVSGIGPSSYHYTKWLIDVRQYISLPAVVLATRLKVGQIRSMDASGFIPVEDRLYSGGANSVRGWARHELGPQDANGKPIGGQSLIEGSLEVRLPLMGSFGIVTFWDFGNVWQENFGSIVDNLRHAFGTGLRFHTPIGPVRFDIARPVFDEVNQIRWHLTLGEAF